MGTNYYLHQEPDCECCGRPFEPLHIGKSSVGWCFAMHVMPERGINTYDDWCDLWNAPGAYVSNEYGERIQPKELMEIITQRVLRGKIPQRHQVDGKHCVGHGEGTWDYIEGEFS